MIKWRHCAHFLLLALIIFMLILYDNLETHFREIARLTFNSYSLFALISIFPAILGIALFTRYFISMKCHYKRPYLVWLCVLIIMTGVMVLADRYYFMQNIFFYGIIVWTETLCEFFTLRKTVSDR